ncbi:outer membrane lipoprotein LolB [Pseudomethylobacillus aquaticus]|uniref:Outer-membrane lipoprotein LolB n=1 Tax=Pseudomethylobacillus aquaticus TaxID=2676064 RepID=A0A3N0V6V7_9PROT|nr:lipoprotein insertase outer membrane protein LolB [Pseudomethylobacillus aquaticus]ROH88453.1 outer membrane lipoprotein LolB [Pseudomethylobacillus aquaticus]
MSQARFTLALTLGLALLSGCTTLPVTPVASSSAPASVYAEHLAKQAQLSDFHLQGRIAVQNGQRGFSARSDWQHAGVTDQISLYSPLGSQVAEIAADPSQVSLRTQDGKLYQAADAESLTEQTLGWRLPLRGLSDWVLGRPADSAVTLSRWDDMGRLLQLQQDGWDIVYSEYLQVDGYQLPQRITLRNAQLTIKLISSQWKISPQNTGITP